MMWQSMGALVVPGFHLGPRGEIDGEMCECQPLLDGGATMTGCIELFGPLAMHAVDSHCFDSNYA